MKSMVDIVRNLPGPLKSAVYRTYALFGSKYGPELAFWKSRWDLENRSFRNDHYRRLMLAMAGESSDDFVRDKIVADFGCGPRGSLVWATAARVRVGIDVLADRYAALFQSAIESHGMFYVKCTESCIPISTGTVDVLFTLNAMDHVTRFDVMCKEVVRILKPGGEFIASLNLDEPPAPCEPQRLTEELVRAHLLSHLDVKSVRISTPGPKDDVYAPFLKGSVSHEKGKRAIMWVRGGKPRVSQLHPP